MLELPWCQLWRPGRVGIITTLDFRCAGPTVVIPALDDDSVDLVADTHVNPPPGVTMAVGQEHETMVVVRVTVTIHGAGRQSHIAVYRNAKRRLLQRQVYFRGWVGAKVVSTK